MPELLLELFSEEIPARMQARAREDLRKLVTDGLVEAGLTYASAGALSTPRRLCLTIDGLTAQSQPVREERKGPKTDAPEKALEGFLRSTGLTLDQLEIRDDKKGQVYFAVVEKPGRSAAEIIADVLKVSYGAFAIAHAAVVEGRDREALPDQPCREVIVVGLRHAHRRHHEDAGPRLVRRHPALHHLAI